MGVEGVDLWLNIGAVVFNNGRAKVLGDCVEGGVVHIVGEGVEESESDNCVRLRG